MATGLKLVYKVITEAKTESVCRESEFVYFTCTGLYVID